jgi:ParB family chromosome partitioning protein
VLANQAGKKSKGTSATPDADITRLQIEISGRLGARVRIDHTTKGSGKLVINYNSLAELDGILEHIK